MQEELPKDIDLCEQCRYDVKFTAKAVTDYGTPRLAEFKSYSTDTWAGIATNTKFVEQFKRYLGATEITKLDELAYVVNTSKASVTDVKKAFKSLFEAKATEIFKPSNQGGIGITKIKQLFGQDIDDINDFIEKLDDFSSQNSVYKFIREN